ncbi:MAG: SAM-dependent methyltransferase [Gammaproteobacteria bacterium]
MNACTDLTDIARNYYDSDDADGFYARIWGGEDIHIGLYQDPEEPIVDASRRTVEAMAAMVQELDADTRVLDVGAGYGGAARWLVRQYGCRVSCLNLSVRQNERNRHLNGQQGLDERIEVIDGAFEDIPLRDASVDLVWSQDAILHSGHKQRVLQEIHRVLRPGGQFLFTDPMQSDDCPVGVLQPILDRIHLDSLGSFAGYRGLARDIGFEEIRMVDQTPHLVNHYRRVKAELEAHHEDLARECSRDYLERMRQGLQHWVDGGRKGYLAWGMLHLRKRATA